MIRNRFYPLIRAGFLFFLLASLWHWFIHPTAILSDAWVDGINGLLLGVSIGCFLFGMAKSRREQGSPLQG